MDNAVNLTHALDQEKLLGQKLKDNLELLRSRHELENQRAENSGASAGDQTVKGVGDKTQEGAAEVAIAFEAYKEALKQVVRADNTFRAVPEGRDNDADRTKAKGELAKAEGEANRTMEGWKTVTEKYRIDIAKDAEEAQRKLTDTAAKGDSDIAAKGIELIEQARQKQDGVISAVAQNAENILQPIRDAATGSKDEQQKAIAALQIFTQTSDAQNAGITQNIWALITMINTQRTETAKQWQAIQKMQNDALAAQRTIR